jgi:uncharacterized protein (TIGR02118 family)
MSGAQVIIVYPRKEGNTFDKNHYLSTHMPLVAKVWKKHGLKSYKCTELNADAPYTYSCIMEWESDEGFAAAGADPATKEVMDDVANFSSVMPIIMHGIVFENKTL